MSRRVKGLLAAGAVLAFVALVCWFVLPGARFGAMLCAAAIGGLCLWELLRRWAGRSQIGARCRAFFLACLCAGAVTFVALEGAIFSHATGETERSADAVIVLGAGVNGTVPSLALQTRINAAAAYLGENPGIPAILSGGQGPGEDITEARALYTALTAKGIDPAHLYLEERSTSTAENFAFSKELLAEAGVEPEDAVIAVVSNDFHLYRAERIARSVGLDPVGVPAPLPLFFLSINYYIREAFALANTLLFQL